MGRVGCILWRNMAMAWRELITCDTEVVFQFEMTKIFIFTIIYFMYIIKCNTDRLYL